MSAETAVRAMLLADAGVSAVVAARIYPLVLPQRPATGSTTPWVPAIVYQRISANHDVDQDGEETPGPVRLQLDLWSQTNDVAADLRDRVLAAINGKAGPGLQGVFGESEAPVYDDEVRLYGVSMDFMVFEGEAA